MAAPQGIVKNLLIKDSSGNTQMIEVVQTAPGKFVTASGHSIKTAVTPGAGGTKTVLRAVPSTATLQAQQPQILFATPGTGNVTPQIIRTSAVTSTPTTIFKGTQGRQVLTIPVQTTGGLANATVLKNIKTEVVTTPIIQQQQRTTATPLVIGNAPVLQVIQAGNQRLLVTQAPGTSQLVTTSLAPQQQTLAPQLQFVTAAATSDPNVPGGSQQLTASLAPTLNLKQNFISPILDHTGARKRVDFPSDVSYESKRRKAEKGGKGLRHFSMKVCEKVRTKGITTYNEVADELVQEFASPNVSMSSIEQQFDQKNIRRRVYDALNVLMAMNIISKEKKEIKWLGLPTNSMQECTTLEKDRQKRIERLKTKTQQLHDLIIQQVAFKCLVERNKEREKECGPPPPHGSIHLPFLIVNTAKNTVIDCSISSDKMEYLFNFDGTFEIHDDIEVLKRMGLALGLDKGECTDEDIAKAKRVLPKALEMYIDQIGRRDLDWRAEFGDDLEEPYYHDEEHTDENTENVCYEMSGASTLGLSGLNATGDFSMSVEDLEMHAAMESLHGQSGMDDDDTQDNGDDEEVFDDDDDEDGLGG